jgi:hypothetical protein
MNRPLRRSRLLRVRLHQQNCTGGYLNQEMLGDPRHFVTHGADELQ